jgi:hypothetical protein
LVTKKEDDIVVKASKVELLRAAKRVSRKAMSSVIKHKNADIQVLYSGTKVQEIFDRESLFNTDIIQGFIGPKFSFANSNKIQV